LAALSRADVEDLIERIECDGAVGPGTAVEGVDVGGGGGVGGEEEVVAGVAVEEVVAAAGEELVVA
jgi:hypothetical protein